MIKLRTLKRQYKRVDKKKQSLAELQNILWKKLMAHREREREPELRLRRKALLGTLASRRAGLGYLPNTQVGNARGKERHHLLSEEVRAGVEEEQVSRPVGDSRDRGLGGRVHCSARLPCQTSCSQISSVSSSWCTQFIMPCARFALEEAH